MRPGALDQDGMPDFCTAARSPEGRTRRLLRAIADFTADSYCRATSSELARHAAMRTASGRSPEPADIRKSLRQLRAEGLVQIAHYGPDGMRVAESSFEERGRYGPGRFRLIRITPSGQQVLAASQAGWRPHE